MDKLLLENVSKVYGSGENAVTALDAVSLTVREGEFVAVVGPSGSGKTTLLALTGALLLPTSGTITLNGEDTKRLAPSALAKFRLEHIGFVLQSSNLVPYLTARDQLLLVAELAGKRDKAAHARATHLLDALGLSKRHHHYPEALSGGERQRVAIARALMNDPDVLLADEPTANLDSVRGREAVQMLAAQVRTSHKAAIMVTHDERMLDLCDRVVRIADGRLSDAPMTARH
ncbi:MAG: Heme efflux system ATPase HrtA [Ktedonobacterales bacterium]|jgi:putative ABC transport system ATP-binding protein|nr:MAG: Heme efflux system ATPase HrtA [Ktedonobacterales bacterium]